MITKFDDYVIDVILQKFLYFTQLCPAKASFHAFGIAFCLSLVVFMMEGSYSILLCSLACATEMVIKIITPHLPDIRRYNSMMLCMRWVGVLLLIIDIVIFLLVPSRNEFLSFLYLFFWLLGEFVGCCKSPPKKKKKLFVFNRVFT